MHNCFLCLFGHAGIIRTYIDQQQSKTPSILYVIKRKNSLFIILKYTVLLNTKNSRVIPQLNPQVNHPTNQRALPFY